MVKHQSKKYPFSGDKLVDTLFLMLLEALKNEVQAIHMKNILRDPDDKRKELFGILTEERIYLGKRKHRKKEEPLVKTLIHELLHVILSRSNHRFIRGLEQQFWIRFTDSQKRYLRNFIPRHTVKKEPGIL